MFSLKSQIYRILLEKYPSFNRWAFFQKKPCHWSMRTKQRKNNFSLIVIKVTIVTLIWGHIAQPTTVFKYHLCRFDFQSLHSNFSVVQWREIQFSPVHCDSVTPIHSSRVQIQSQKSQFRKDNLTEENQHITSNPHFSAAYSRARIKNWDSNVASGEEKT